MRRILLLLAMVVLALTGLIGAAAPVAALAPAPPPDACLRKGSFDLTDHVCAFYGPRYGAQYGHISGITFITAKRGEPIPLTLAGAGDVRFGRQPDSICGDQGCITYGISWRSGSVFSPGVGYVSGCGAEDATCTVVSNPGVVGDAGEVYTPVYGQLFLGRSATATSHMWAIYTPPTIYPVELTPVDSSGARLALDHDVVAYAVRAGSNPSAADCVEPFWYVAELTKTVPDAPSCVTFQRGGSIYSLEGTFQGWLPVDSGRWTIVAEPAGDAGAPLLSRPSGYTQVTVAPVGDDINATIIGQRRPDLAIDIVAPDAELALGETQVVDVTVSAVGGEAGSLQGITFVDPAVLLQGKDAPPLAILGVEPAVPDAGFSLGLGESRTFAVTVQAVALGADALGAAVTGQNDLGEPRAAAERGLAFLVDPGELGGPGAPEPPTVTQVIASDGATTGSLEGTVAGAPGEDVIVTLATAPILPEDVCVAELDRAEVVGLGSLPVTIDDDGIGRFAMPAALAGGHHVYGVTVAAAGVSAVGPCTAVSEATPTLSVEDAEVTEGTAKQGSTGLEVTLRLSGPPLAPVSVRFSTADGTATAPDDYTAITGQTVTFTAGQRSATVTIDVAPDGAAEPDETIGLVLSDPVGLTIGTGTATATIGDDDAGGSDKGAAILGTWRFDEAGGDTSATSTLEITDIDPQAGAWKGRFVITLDPGVKLAVKATCFKGGRVCTLPATGTLRGARFSLSVMQDGRKATLSGKLVRKQGTLTASLSGRNVAGQATTGRITLTDPAS